MQITEEIKARRSTTKEQALLMLDMIPLSDTENKYTLLSSVAYYLNDPEVVSKWISLIPTETDTRLKNEMLHRLSAGGIQAIPDKDAFISLLSDALGQDESRDIILWLLVQLSMTHVEARQKLRSFYKEHNNAETRHNILSWLLIPTVSSEEDVAFYNSILNEVDTADKLVLINRLLLQDKMTYEQIAQLLQPFTPDAIKEMVLRYCVDRSIVPEAELCILIRIDKSALLRRWSIQLLAVYGIKDIPVLDALMYALKADPDAAVRDAAMRVFAYSITLNPETISYLSYCISSEKDSQLALNLLYLLAPYSDKNPALSDALFALLNQQLEANLTLAIYDILGKQVPVNASMLDKFIAAYDKEQIDDAKAIILKAISSSMNAGGEWNSFYLKALKSPAIAIREWAIHGILMIPLTPENTADVAAAAPALLQPELNRDLRRSLARKISRIPKLAAEAVAVFARIQDYERDEQLISTATLVQEKAIMQSGASSIDWDQWLYKADVSHDVSGIFPHLWLFYEENPEMAKKVLYACLNPANDNTLYGHGIGEVDILEFMIATFGIDDQLVQYATSHLLQADLTYGGMFYHYMLIIKSNPSHPDLKPALWQLLEIRGTQSSLNLIQLDELLNKIWGADLEEAFRQRLLLQQTVNGMLPYLRYLTVNNTWSSTPVLLQNAIQIFPGMLEDPSFKNAFKEACRSAGVDADTLIRLFTAPPPEAVDDGPGFAD